MGRNELSPMMKIVTKTLKLVICCTANILLMSCEKATEPKEVGINAEQLELESKKAESRKMEAELLVMRQDLKRIKEEVDLNRRNLDLSDATESIEKSEIVQSEEGSSESLVAEPVALEEEKLTQPVLADDSHQEQHQEILQQALERQDFQVFFVELSRYGQWFETDEYGYVWQPASLEVQPDWRPYTRGRWLYSDQGWTWVSDEPFGWAVYHYGRWALSQQRGWVWIPGEDWAPAWVSWRSNEEYLGWAPLPPETVYDEDYSYDGRSDSYYDSSPESYSFVPVEHFHEPVEVYCVPPAQVPSIIIHTRNVTRIHVSDSMIHSEGPGLEWVKRHNAHAFKNYKLNLHARHVIKYRKNHWIEDRNLQIFAPKVKAAWNPVVRPIHVEGHLGKLKVVHGGKTMHQEVKKRFNLGSVKRQQAAMQALKSKDGHQALLRHRANILGADAHKHREKSARKIGDPGRVNVSKVAGKPKQKLAGEVKETKSSGTLSMVGDKRGDPGKEVKVENSAQVLVKKQHALNGKKGVLLLGKKSSKLIKSSWGRGQHSLGEETGGKVSQSERQQVKAVAKKEQSHAVAKKDISQQAVKNDEEEQKQQGLRVEQRKNSARAELERRMEEMKQRKRELLAEDKQKAELQKRQQVEEEKEQAESQRRKGEMEQRQRGLVVETKQKVELRKRQQVEEEKARAETQRRKVAMEQRQRALMVEAKQKADLQKLRQAAETKMREENLRRKKEFEQRQQLALAAVKQRAEQTKARAESQRKKVEMDTRKRAAEQAAKKAEQQSRQRQEEAKERAHQQKEKAQRDSRRRAEKAARQRAEQEKAEAKRKKFEDTAKAERQKHSAKNHRKRKK